MPVLKTSMPDSASAAQVARSLMRRTLKGAVAVSHHSSALCGAVLLAVVLVLSSRADVRGQVESWTLDWLLTRQEAREGVPAEVMAEDTEEDNALAATPGFAKGPAKLDRQQAAVAQWISKRYHVASVPISNLVQEAWALGRQAKLEPTLILAIMAVESSFNPYAQSAVGAQGLMQVMTAVHDDKYRPFGGTHAAFDPLSNLHVGVTVLKECVLRAGGSLEGGLRLYVGAGNMEDDGGYAAKVMAEQEFLSQVALGRAVPVNARWTATPATITPTIQPTPPAAPTSPTAKLQAITEAASVPSTVQGLHTLMPGEAERVALAQ